MSICSIEDVAANTDQPFWFQLYVMRDRDFIERLIDRAKAAGCSALVLTLDLQILGQRHKDLKNGLSAPPKTDARQHRQPGDQAALVPGHAGHQAPHASATSSATRRASSDMRVAVGLDGRAVRPDAQLGRRRVDQGALGRQADPEGHPRRRGRRAGGARAAPTR